MFVEVDHKLLKQSSGKPNSIKRWFRDADRDCDIFIWQNDSKEIIRFQFWLKEYLLEWNQRRKFKTGKLDSDIKGFKSYQSPTYKYHSNPDTIIIHSVFNIISDPGGGDLPKAVREKVVRIIQDSRITD